MQIGGDRRRFSGPADVSFSESAGVLLPLTLLKERSVTRLIAAGLDASNVACALFSPDDTLDYASAAFLRLFNVAPDARSFADIMRHCHATASGPVMTPPVDAWLEMAQARRRSSPRRSFEIDISDGRWFLVDETVLVGGWLWSVFIDITMLKSNERVLQLAHDAARLAAETDPLTGIYNRRHAMKSLEEAVGAAFNNGAPLSLVLIDLDHFKAINDRYGHVHGDRVLCHFAAAGREQLRGQDMFARIGGEEFMVLMPGTGAVEAFHAIQRMRRHLSQSDAVDGIICPYTMSAGIAEYCGGTVEQFFEDADRALYRGKALGRDRIERAS